MPDPAALGQPIQQLIAALGHWIVELPGFIEAAVERDPRLGYLALGLAMLLENLIPPIPSELIQPLGGFLVQQGRLQLVPVILVGLAGTVLGAWFWYWVGRWIGEERLLVLLQRRGGWLGIGPTEVATSRAWFARYGLGLVLWGRLVPGIRTLISVPAGLEKMGQGPFLLATLTGSLIWVTALTLVGRALGAGYGEVVALTGPYARACQLLLMALALVALGGLARRALRRSSEI
jgi:membrane protein DedA with SNARE-associated domain